MVRGGVVSSLKLICMVNFIASAKNVFDTQWCRLLFHEINWLESTPPFEPLSYDFHNLAALSSAAESGLPVVHLVLYIGIRIYRRKSTVHTTICIQN